jgi:hypothetical protein
MVLDGCHLSHRWTVQIVSKIAYRDSTVHELHDSGNPDILNSDSPGSLATHPRRRTVQIRLGNRVSRFQHARVSCLREPRFPISDSSGSSATCPCCLNGSDPIGKSRIAISYCNGSTLLNPPMGEIPIPPRTPTRVLPRSTARIRSRDFENHKASILKLNKTPMTHISR